MAGAALLTAGIPLVTGLSTAAPASAAPTHPSTPSSTSSIAVPDAGLTRYLAQTPRWASCGDPGAPDFECTTIVAPLDYRHPGGATLSIAVSRIRAPGPSCAAGSC